ncbi:hypothetical protein BOTBODRAFT_142768 [Botryobasidium botryosum FD-172 SS1]|uniref:Uncharacterized protein n=1 Tax=Botryobasidium botryosum (strain FD-172 SS1) TaxID=930990 RepID=A0A067MZV0_BOTB1|nr:hypothetical protein BOTBODRAFT_142768 [Botryobasidium botryosum FD-172 SS1]
MPPVDPLLAERDALDLKELTRFLSSQDLSSVPTHILGILVGIISRKNLLEEEHSTSADGYKAVILEHVRQCLCARNALGTRDRTASFLGEALPGDEHISDSSQPTPSSLNGPSLGPTRILPPSDDSHASVRRPLPECPLPPARDIPHPQWGFSPDVQAVGAHTERLGGSQGFAGVPTELVEHIEQDPKAVAQPARGNSESSLADPLLASSSPGQGIFRDRVPAFEAATAAKMFGEDTERPAQHREPSLLPFKARSKLSMLEKRAAELNLRVTEVLASRGVVRADAPGGGRGRPLCGGQSIISEGGHVESNPPADAVTSGTIHPLFASLSRPNGGVPSTALDGPTEAPVVPPFPKSEVASHETHLPEAGVASDIPNQSIHRPEPPTGDVQPYVPRLSLKARSRIAKLEKVEAALAAQILAIGSRNQAARDDGRNGDQDISSEGARVDGNPPVNAMTFGSIHPLFAPLPDFTQGSSLQSETLPPPCGCNLCMRDSTQSISANATAVSPALPNLTGTEDVAHETSDPCACERSETDNRPISSNPFSIGHPPHRLPSLGSLTGTHNFWGTGPPAQPRSQIYPAGLTPGQHTTNSDTRNEYGAHLYSLRDVVYPSRHPHYADHLSGDLGFVRAPGFERNRLPASLLAQNGIVDTAAARSLSESSAAAQSTRWSPMLPRQMIGDHLPQFSDYFPSASRGSGNY